MQAPTGLRKIAYNMHQDIFVVHDTHDEILEFAMHNLSPEERLETKTFLTELLTEPIDLRKVRDIWSELWTEIRIDDDRDLGEFLKMIRDRLVA